MQEQERHRRVDIVAVAPTRSEFDVMAATGRVLQKHLLLQLLG
jgi:hypothetical protein